MHSELNTLRRTRLQLDTNPAFATGSKARTLRRESNEQLRTYTTEILSEVHTQPTRVLCALYQLLLTSEDDPTDSIERIVAELQSRQQSGDSSPRIASLLADWQEQQSLAAALL